MQSGEPPKSGMLKWRQRIGYGIGDYACNLAYLLMNTYLLFYYTNYAGLSPAAMGTMLLVTKLFDAVTDYLVGTWVDHTDTRMGRYRPWMLSGAPVLALGMALLFSVPLSWSAGGKLIWAYGTYILYSFGYTLVNIPMTPLISSLSPNSMERTYLATSRQVFASLGALTVSLLAVPVIRFFSGAAAATGAALARGYQRTSEVLAVLVLVILTASVCYIREIVPPVRGQNRRQDLPAKDLILIFQNRYFVILLAYCVVYCIGFLGLYAAMQYYFTYVIGDLNAMSVCMTILTVVPVPWTLAGAKLNAIGLGKGKLLLIGSAVSGLGALGLLFTTTTIPITLICIGIYASGIGLRAGILYSALSDVFEFTEYRLGRSLGGIQTAVIGFGSKAGSAVASWLTALLLTWGHYQGDVMDDLLRSGLTAASLADVYPNTILAVRVSFALLPMLSSFICMIILLPYDLDAICPIIRKELEERRRTPE